MYTDQEKKDCWDAIVSAAGSYKTISINLRTAVALETILDIGKRLSELESLSKQAHIAQLTSEREWEALTPQSRHRLNVWTMDAEKLAALVLTLFGTSEYKRLRGPIREEVERLAHLLAPPTVEHIVTGEGIGNPTRYTEAVAPHVYDPGVHVIDNDDGIAHIGSVVGGAVKCPICGNETILSALTGLIVAHKNEIGNDCRAYNMTMSVAEIMAQQPLIIDLPTDDK